MALKSREQDGGHLLRWHLWLWLSHRFSLVRSHRDALFVDLDRVTVEKEHLAFQVGCNTGQAEVALGYFFGGGSSVGTS